MSLPIEHQREVAAAGELLGELLEHAAALWELRGDVPTATWLRIRDAAASIVVHASALAELGGQHE